MAAAVPGSTRKGFCLASVKLVTSSACPGTSASCSARHLGTLEAGPQHYLHLKSFPMEDGPGAVKGGLLPLCSGLSFPDKRCVFSGGGSEVQSN